MRKLLAYEKLMYKVFITINSSVYAGTFKAILFQELFHTILRYSQENYFLRTGTQCIPLDQNNIF
jgi:hypothetical protein